MGKLVSLVVIVLRWISCFYLLIPKHFTDTQAIVYVCFSDSSKVPVTVPRATNLGVRHSSWPVFVLSPCGTRSDPLFVQDGGGERSRIARAISSACEETLK